MRRRAERMLAIGPKGLDQHLDGVTVDQTDSNGQLQDSPIQFHFSITDALGRAIIELEVRPLLT